MRILLFAVALIAGGMAYWLWLTQASLVPTPAALSSGVQGVRVLVAAQDIAAGATLAEADMVWAEIPAKDLATGMSVQGNDPDAGKRMVGARVLIAVAAGAPILRDAVMGGGGQSLADLVAPDKRAFAIVVSEASAVGGLVQPGDRIDLIQTSTSAGKPVAQVLVENLLVLAVDQRLSAMSEAAPARTLTLELTPQEMTTISAAATLGG